MTNSTKSSHSIVIIDKEARGHTRTDPSTILLGLLEQVHSRHINRLIIRANVPQSFHITAWLKRHIYTRLEPGAEILDERRFR
jgi:hypothetical protein